MKSQQDLVLLMNNVDKGRSNNACTGEVRGKKNIDSDRDAYQIFEGQLIYNEKAYEFLVMH